MSFDVQEQVTLKGTITFTVDAADKKSYASVFKGAATVASENGLTDLAKEFTSVAKKLGGRGRPKGSTNKKKKAAAKKSAGKKKISIEAADEEAAEEMVDQKKPIRIKAVKSEEVVDAEGKDGYDEYDEYVPADQSSEEEFDEFA